MKWIHLLFLISASLIYSCMDNAEKTVPGQVDQKYRSFYEYSTKEDLYRIPLIEPYELIIIFGAEDDRTNVIFSAWDLKLIYGHYFFSSARAEEINVKNGIIFGCTPKSHLEPDIRFVINPKEKEEKIFRNEEKAWRSFLASKGIDSIKLYNVWKLFDKFRSDKTLPWYNPKEGVFPMKDSSLKAK